jgi:putative DNA primase/helicase
MSGNMDELADIAADALGRKRTHPHGDGGGKGRPVTVEPGTGTTKPKITVEPGHIDVLATAAEDALIEAQLAVFQRGGMLVRPAAWSVPASDERTTLAAGLRPINTAAMIDLLAQAAIWTRYNGRRKKYCPIDPPSNVAAVLLSRSGFWRVPSIIGTITTPTMRRDGSILADPGFDPATRLYHWLDPNLHMPPIGSSRADAERALARLDELLIGFPFVDNVDHAVGLSGLISPCVRGAVGAVPAHALSAPTAGSGKSHCVDLAAAILTGRPCPVATAGRNEEETEKRLGGLLLAGFPIISLDNTSDPLGGDLLCQAVERPIIRLRPLGGSDIVEIESCATIYCTGNNLVVAGDMTRRTLLAHFDARMERPEERQFTFDPVQRVIGDRGTYVAACLTIVRAYLLARCPGKLPQLASFGAWSDLVRSALVWLGCADPAQSIQEARRSDPVLDTLRQVIGAWHRCFGQEGQTARKVASTVANFDPITETGDALLALRAALAPIASDRGQIDASKLGYWLRKNKDRIVGGLKFAVIGEPHGVAEWAVRTG